MAISGVNPKCYILALFVRDDGARFLLGDDPYEFKDKQLHFQQNTIANDVVEVQGNDGYLLAGQVRRPGSQTFDGYVCNGTNSKEEVETKRRAFLQFFRRSHFYKVIYVFPNGTAIQRKQGFLVDDPTVQELYQQYPEYHVALNFEDVNYYTYEEDDQGQEIYAKEAIIKLTGGGATGGLIWDNYGVVWEDPWSLPLSISGVQFQVLNNSGVRAPIDSIELYGDTYQQTYSGYNLINLVPMTKEQPSFYQQCTIETVADSTLGRNVLHVAGTNSFPSAVYQLPQRLESGKYYVLKFTYRSTMNSTATHPELWFAPNWSGNNWDVLGSITNDHMRPGDGDTASMTPQSTNWKTTCRKFYVDPSRYSSVDTSYSRICFSLGNNSNSAGSEGKEVWLADAEVYEITEDEWNADTYTSKDFEPYVGGIPAPNPDYPQDVQTVTGEQAVTVTGKNLLNLDSAMPTVNSRLNIIEQNSNNLLLEAVADSGNYNNANYRLNLRDIGVNVGETYTISANISGTYTGANGASIRISKNNSASGVDILARTSGEPATFTIPEGTTSIGIFFYVRQGSAPAIGSTASFVNIQLERNDSATVYEPYKGIQAYTVDLRGKNLLDISKFEMGGINASGVVSASTYRIQNRNSMIKVQPNTTYTISAQLSEEVKGFRVGAQQFNGAQGFLYDPGWKQLATQDYTFTTRADTEYIAIVGSLSTTSANVSTGGTENTTPYTSVSQFMRGCTLMLEEGSTATAYEPYNAIELCKIGDYQDYIYKSGDDWYVHKETKKVVLNGSEDWTLANVTAGYTRALISSVGFPTQLGYCDELAIRTGNHGAYEYIYFQPTTVGALYIQIMTERLTANTLNAFKAWLSNNPATAVYSLMTPTDTQITDETLVGQLNALGAMKLFIGENNLLVSATGTNLPATLEFSYPTKFATIGAEWEEGGTKGATIVDVDAIDNTYPVWELIGPATNPTISVLTTNTTLTYNGTITASQRLVIDMFNKTATLNGTSVIGNVSGDFVYMAPGTNRVAYTADNTDAPDSTIYWQEVVG